MDRLSPYPGVGGGSSPAVASHFGGFSRKGFPPDLPKWGVGKGVPPGEDVRRVSVGSLEVSDEVGGCGCGEWTLAGMRKTRFLSLP